MKKEAKTVIAGAVMVAIGGVLLDCGVKNTGVVFVILGMFFMIFGPMAMCLWD